MFQPLLKNNNNLQILKNRKLKKKMKKTTSQMRRYLMMRKAMRLSTNKASSIKSRNMFNNIPLLLHLPHHLKHFSSIPEHLLINQ
jgi:hypothetical protein